MPPSPSLATAGLWGAEKTKSNLPNAWYCAQQDLPAALAAVP